MNKKIYGGKHPNKQDNIENVITKIQRLKLVHKTSLNYEGKEKKEGNILFWSLNFIKNLFFVPKLIFFFMSKLCKNIFQQFRDKNKDEKELFFLGMKNKFLVKFNNIIKYF